jgi:hypothetical protein
VTPDLLERLAQSLLDCACTALEATTCGCPCHVFISAGAVAWDRCCDDGMLWVGIDRLYAYERFPAPATGAVMCMPPLAADLTISVLRCAPTLSDQGDAPSVEALTTSSAQVYEDAYAIITAVVCCLAPYARARPFVIGNQRPLGPSGGCTGTELRFTVALTDPPPNCEDC